MPEMTPYFESILSKRAMAAEVEDMLTGSELVSLETQADLVEDDVFSFVHEILHRSFVRYVSWHVKIRNCF